MSKVLCIVAHPDDEVLGAGATLAGHAQAGDEVHIQMLTEGVGSRGGDMKDAERREEMAKEAAKAIGAHPPRFCFLPDQRLDTQSFLNVVQFVIEGVGEVKPDTIYTHHVGDLNLDHAICARAVLTACRPLPGSSVRRIYAMEVPSSTEWAPERPFVPNRFVPMTAKTRTAKRIALQAYEAEMRPYPHARSLPAIEALEVMRGTSVGVEIAEAFTVLREIA